MVLLEMLNPMEMKMKKDVYSTKDLAEATLLYVKQLKLLSLERQDNHFQFIFQDKEKAEKLSAKFWQKDVKIDAKTYSEGMRYLKDRLFAGR